MNELSRAAKQLIKEAQEGAEVSTFTLARARRAVLARAEEAPVRRFSPKRWGRFGWAAWLVAGAVIASAGGVSLRAYVVREREAVRNRQRAGKSALAPARASQATVAANEHESPSRPERELSADERVEPSAESLPSATTASGGAEPARPLSTAASGGAEPALASAASTHPSALRGTAGSPLSGGRPALPKSSGGSRFSASRGGLASGASLPSHGGALASASGGPSVPSHGGALSPASAGSSAGSAAAPVPSGSNPSLHASTTGGGTPATSRSGQPPREAVRTDASGREVSASAGARPEENPPAALALNRPQRCSLEDELSALARAQRALSRSAFREAQREAETLALRCRGGALVEERLATEVLAACGLGEWERAEEKADVLRTLAPTSPAWTRVNSSCRFRK